jgi:hypothetical protein
MSTVDRTSVSQRVALTSEAGRIARGSIAGNGASMAPGAGNAVSDRTRPEARGTRSARRTERAAGFVLAIRRAVPLSGDLLRLWTSIVLALGGLSLLASAALADRYYHRGVMTGAEEPYAIHPVGREMATNVDFDAFQTEGIADVATALQANGFRFVRMTVLWSRVEAEPGRVDWTRTDLIVDELAKRDIAILAVLRGTPTWARVPDMAASDDAPPADPGAFAHFARSFAERYADRVDFVQVWDLPNRADRWGGRPGTPTEYAVLLAAARSAISEVAPAILIVLAEFEPFPGQGAAGDLDFLRGLYDADAAPFFDIVAATVDGGGRSPYDRRTDAGSSNFSRVILFHDLMQDVGDASTPVWGTRYGWRVGAAPTAVTPDQAADFSVDGIERAREELPWLGSLFAWSLISSKTDPAAGYALLTPEGSRTPVFTALSSFANDPASTLAGVGYVPTSARPLAFTGRWQEQSLPPRVYKTTTEVDASVSVDFSGTGLIAYLRLGPKAQTIEATIDGEPLASWSGSSLWAEQAQDVPLVLVSGLEDGTHRLVLTLTEEGELTLGGFVVTRDLPFLWPVGLLTCGGALLIFLAVWTATGLAATRAGLLRRRRGEDVWLNAPELPHLPSVRRT